MASALFCQCCKFISKSSGKEEGLFEVEFYSENRRNASAVCFVANNSLERPSNGSPDAARSAEVGHGTSTPCK